MLSHLRVHALRDSNSRFVLGLSPVKQFRRFIGLDKKKKSDGAGDFLQSLLDDDRVTSRRIA